jgi:steroid delta-isomerase-like uncharacterized protein
MALPTEEVAALINAYNTLWNEQDLDGIDRMHHPDIVFENHTAGERAEGDAVRRHIAGIFASWPDLAFETRRLYVADDLVVQEWTASATHDHELRRGELVSPASGRRIEWAGCDVIPCADGLIKRKDVYSDSVGILRQVGLLS